MNKTPPTILLRERQPQLATLSSGAGKTVEPFYWYAHYNTKMTPNSRRVSPENLKKVFAHTADSFLGLVRQVLDMQYLPDYKDLVARQFEDYVIKHNYNADQIRFLRAVQSVFLQKRHLETADTSTALSASLYEPPLDMFGADAVERWFTEKEVEEVVEFVQRLSL